MKYPLGFAVTTLSIAAHARGVRIDTSAANDPRPVLVVSGMKSEADIVRVEGAINIISAGNAAQLRAALRPYNASNVRAVVSFGIAGGLNPALVSGDIVVASKIITETTTLPTDARLSAELLGHFKSAGINAIRADLAATETLTTPDAASRAALYKATGADVVDMESGISAEFATVNHLPFITIRAVADPASFNLPPAALLPLKPDGTPDGDAIQASLHADPSQMSSLIDLNNDTNKAYDSLKACQSADNVQSL